MYNLLCIYLRGDKHYATPSPDPSFRARRRASLLARLACAVIRTQIDRTTANSGARVSGTYRVRGGSNSDNCTVPKYDSKVSYTSKNAKELYYQKIKNTSTRYQ